MPAPVPAEAIHYGPTTLAWLAGIIDGEGSFGCYKDRCVMVVEMTDEDTVRKVAQLWERKVRTRQRDARKRVFSVSVCSKPVIAWLLALYPYFSARRQEQVRHIIGECCAKKA